MATGYERLVLTQSRADAWIVILRGEPGRESTQALRDEIDELLDRRSRQPVVVNLAAGTHAQGDEPVEASYQELVHEAVAVGSELCVICAPRNRPSPWLCSAPGIPA
ncbi:hypothetical protein ACQP04_23515 [Pseudonocardia halophobica]|uniref:hypothetical protein n=1 Tax=Pseudonocardia halophobica TaxID=29401 RepID=UPI003D90ACEA